MRRFAVISDIHGNRWALEAVLDDIDRQAVSEALNLGDVLYGPLDPLGTAEILMPRSFATVSGNEDRIVVACGEPLSATLRFVRDQLQPTHLQWLTSFKKSLSTGEVHAFHGSPTGDSDYLFWEVRPTGAALRSPDHVSAMTRNLPWSLLLCGHDHVPRTMRLPDGRTVVNPGSVGLPAYTDDLPHPHSMASGTPHARYSIVTRTECGWLIADRAVPYDWQAATAAALRNGRPDWADWLSTGWASA